MRKRLLALLTLVIAFIGIMAAATAASADDTSSAPPPRPGPGCPATYNPTTYASESQNECPGDAYIDSPGWIDPGQGDGHCEFNNTNWPDQSNGLGYSCWSFKANELGSMLWELDGEHVYSSGKFAEPLLPNTTEHFRTYCAFGENDDGTTHHVMDVIGNWSQSWVVGTVDKTVPNTNYPLADKAVTGVFYQNIAIPAGYWISTEATSSCNFVVYLTSPNDGFDS